MIDLVWKSKKTICMGLNSAPSSNFQWFWSQLTRIHGKWQNPAAALLTLHPVLNVNDLTKESMHRPWAFSTIQQYSHLLPRNRPHKTSSHRMDNEKYGLFFLSKNKVFSKNLQALLPKSMGDEKDVLLFLTMCVMN